MKLRVSAWRDMKTLIERIASLTRERSVDWALLLCGEGPPQWDPALEAEAPVLIYGVRDLVERLRCESFAVVISSFWRAFTR